MLKRVGLFLLTNLAVLVLLSIIMFVLEHVFGVPMTGYTGLLIMAMVIGFGGAFISLGISRWMAKKAYGIVPITQEDIPNLTHKQRVVYNTVLNLANAHRITLPEIGFYESSEPNAFATGASKNSSLVAVSTGLLNLMDDDAIEGVIGHEMAHILNGDMVTMTLIQGVANTFVVFLARVVANIVTSFLSNSEEEGNSSGGLVYFLVVMVLEIIFGILASLVIMAFSRHREFRADEGSARYLGKEKMIAGLQALKAMHEVASGKKDAFATMKISSKSGGGILSLFSTHPDLDARIENLRVKAL